MDKIEFLVFIFLSLGLILFFNINFFEKKKGVFNINKSASREKRRKINEQAEIKKYEKFLYIVDNMLLKMGKKRDYLYKLIVFFFAIGVFIGNFVFKGWFLSISTGFSMLPMVYIFLAIKSRDKIRKEISELQNTMSIITNSYMAKNDIVQAVEKYVKEKNRLIEEIGIEKQIGVFDEFVANCLYLSSNIDKNLAILAMKINNKYFSNWINVLRLCVDDKKMRFALQPILDSMADEKIMQIEQDTQMKKSYANYIMVVIAMFATLFVFRIARKEWFDILIYTTGGKIIVFLMLVSSVISGLYVIKVAKPISNI